MMIRLCWMMMRFVHDGDPIFCYFLAGSVQCFAYRWILKLTFGRSFDDVRPFPFTARFLVHWPILLLTESAAIPRFLVIHQETMLIYKIRFYFHILYNAQKDVSQDGQKRKMTEIPQRLDAGDADKLAARKYSSVEYS